MATNREELIKALQTAIEAIGANEKAAIEAFAKKIGLRVADVEAAVADLRASTDADVKGFWDKPFYEVFDEAKNKSSDAAVQEFREPFFTKIDELQKPIIDFATANKVEVTDVVNAIDKMREGDKDWNLSALTISLEEYNKKDAAAKAALSSNDAKFFAELAAVQEAKEKAAIAQYAKDHGLLAAEVEAAIYVQRSSPTAEVKSFWEKPFDQIIKLDTNDPNVRRLSAPFQDQINVLQKPIKEFAEANKDKYSESDVIAAINEMRKAEPTWDFNKEKANLDAAAKQEHDKRKDSDKKFFEALDKAHADRLAAEASAAKKGKEPEKDEQIGGGVKGQKPTVYNFWDFDISYAGADSIMGKMVNALSQWLGGWAMSYVWLAVAQVYSAVATEVTGVTGFTVGWLMRPFFKTQSDIILARAYADSGTLPWFLSMGKFALGTLTGNGELKATAMKEAHEHFYNSFVAKGGNLAGPLVGQIVTSIPAKLTATAGYLLRGDLGNAGKSLSGILFAEGNADTSPGLFRILWEAAKDPGAHIPGISLLAGTCSMTKGVRGCMVGNPKTGRPGLYTSHYGCTEEELLTSKGVCPAIKDMLVYERANVPSNAAKSSQGTNFGKSRAVGNWTLDKGRKLWNLITGKKDTQINPDNASASTQVDPGITSGVHAQTMPKPAATPKPTSGPVSAQLSSTPTDSRPSAQVSTHGETLGTVANVSQADTLAGRMRGVTVNWPGSPSAALQTRLRGFSPRSAVSSLILYTSRCFRGAGLFRSATQEVELVQNASSGGPKPPTQQTTTPLSGQS